MPRRLVLDANVFDQLHRNNHEVATALRRAVKAGDRLYVSTEAYAALTGGRGGVLFTGVGKNRTTSPAAFGPDSAQTARTNLLIIDRFDIRVAPPTTFEVRQHIYDRNASHGSMQPLDSVGVAEAWALDAELWTMERGDRLRAAARLYGVAIARESQLSHVDSPTDHHNALKLAGLESVRVSANGSVTILPKPPGGPRGSSTPPKPSGSGARPTARVVASRLVNAGALELAFQALNFTLQAINNAQEERKLRQAWEGEQAKLQNRLRSNPSMGALVLFVYTQKHKVGQEQDSILDPLREFRDILIGYGPDRQSALQTISAQARVYKNVHGGALYDVVTETIWIPPQKASSTEELLTPPFAPFAVATFAPKRYRLQGVYYSAIGFDDGPEIELSAPSGFRPEFYLLKLPTKLDWIDGGAFRTRYLDISWVEPHNYIFLSRIQTIDLDPVMGIGHTKAAMVYPADQATKRYFGRRGLTDDKDGLLHRSDVGFLSVHWVRPENIDILEDLRKLDRDFRPHRNVVETPHEPPKHFTPDVGGFNMEDDANRPKIFRD